MAHRGREVAEPLDAGGKCGYRYYVPLSFIWRDGVHVEGTPLWCDARRARSLCFLSHAGRRTGTGHRQVLCTERTLRLLMTTSGLPPGAALCTPTGRPFSLGGLRLELFPSGYLPGAASLLISGERDGRRLVYAGDLNPRPGPFSEPMQVRGADLVLCQAPLAALDLPLPERAEAEAALLKLLDAARTDRVPLLILCPPLGVAQELLALIWGHGARAAAHPGIAACVPAYQAFGLPAPLPGALLPLPALGRPPRSADALLWPIDRLPTPAQAGALADLRVRACVCTGAALSPAALSRYRSALPAELPLHGLPFPDGLDRPSLLRYVADSEAREVVLLAGFSAELRALLARRRVRLRAMGPPRQLDLFHEAST